MQIEWSNRLSDELLLRIAPLKQLWEARGVGLLKRVANHTNELILPATATIVPVMPTASGGGTFDRPESVVYIQAMLVNPIPQLPEVARLAWLLAQLSEDCNETNDNVDNKSAASLALIPAVLEAAEDVELVRFDAATLQLALIHWTAMESTRVASVTDTLLKWWQTDDAVSDSWSRRVADLADRLGTALHTKGEACDSN